MEERYLIKLWKLARLQHVQHRISRLAPETVLEEARDRTFFALYERLNEGWKIDDERLASEVRNRFRWELLQERAMQARRASESVGRAVESTAWVNLDFVGNRANWTPEQELLALEDRAHAGQLWDSVGDALGRMTWADQTFLQLRFQENFRGRELRELLGVSQGVIYRREANLVKALRSVLPSELIPAAFLLDERPELLGDDMPLFRGANPPRPLVSAVETVNAELLAYLRRHPQDFEMLPPRRFEELIAEVLASFGWAVELTAQSRDGGYDLFAISSDRAGPKSSWVVECKRYRADRRVGIEIARGLYCVKQELKVSNAMIVTTSDFSSEVRKFAGSRYDMDLRNMQSIIEWLDTYRPRPGGRLHSDGSRLILPGEI